MPDPNQILEISLDNLISLRQELTILRQKDSLTNAEKAGLIKFFELAYEISWKTLKRILFIKNSINIISGTKDIFREAAKQGYIDNPEQWFKFIETRNETVHVYNQENIDSIIHDIEGFLSALESLINKLKEIK